MASLGCVGVNLHGGANGFYSPIVGSARSGFVVRPEYYGLMLAQQFAGYTMHQTRLEASGANLTAYAAGNNEATSLVVVFNKDVRDVDIVLTDALGSFKGAAVERLQSPTVDSKVGVTFEGSEVRSSGEFHPVAGERLIVQRGKLSVRVPAYSAALIHLA
jgi:hypothetical protein